MFPIFHEVNYIFCGFLTSMNLFYCCDIMIPNISLCLFVLFDLHTVTKFVCCWFWLHYIHLAEGYRFSRPQTGCDLPNSPWPGIIKLFTARENLVSEIPAGDGKIDNLFLQCSIIEAKKSAVPVLCSASCPAGEGEGHDLLWWKLGRARHTGWFGSGRSANNNCKLHLYSTALVLNHPSPLKSHMARRASSLVYPCRLSALNWTLTKRLPLS